MTAAMSAMRALRAHYAANRRLSPMQLCAADPRRFARFSLSLDDLLLDFSKTTMTAGTVSLLLQAAKEAGVLSLRDAMFAGEKINKSEGRAALHAALRADAGAHILQNGCDVMPSVVAARAEMLEYAKECRRGQFADVVHIGIGGPHLGAAAAAAALHSYHDGPRLHFVSQMDGAQINDVLARLRPRKTLAIAASKSFATAETLANAKRAREWLAAALGERAAARRLVAATAHPQKAREFGAGRVFTVAEWTGGRHSVWGACGLPLAIAIGERRFCDFLKGARDMDAHFLSASPRRNLPIMFALAGIWHRNFCGYPTRAVLPYDWRLRLLPEYARQLDMEGNGKPGAAAGGKTAPVVWGSPGADAQHAYFQFLHQGADIAPCEFIIAARGDGARDERRRMMAANCFAQSAALMRGDASPGLPPHLRFAGGRPSITILHRKLTPYSLGRLLALFEHRAFAEGAMWGTNPFDQWGVELGKTLAARIEKTICKPGLEQKEDVSTRGLIRRYRRLAAD